jgi:hypothetical protein
METIPQNPIIKAAAQHINKGDNVIDIQIDDPKLDIPTGVKVLLYDATVIHHPIATSSHREFYELFREASNWWCRRQIEEQSRVGD